MNMKNFGNAAWGFREMDLESQLKLTASMGLDIHELGIANAPKDIPQNADKSTLDEVKRLYNKYNVRLVAAATGNDFSAGNDDDFDKIKSVVDECSYLGIKYLRIFAGFSPKTEVVGDRWDFMVKTLNSLAEYSKTKNVVLSIETHGSVEEFENGEFDHRESVTTDAQCLKRLMKELDESIMFTYDPANLFAVGTKYPDTVYQVIKPRVAYVHLKDFKEMPSGHFKSGACGDSAVDWKDILKGLSDFDGPMLLEYEIIEDLEVGLKRSYDYIMKELENV